MDTDETQIKTAEKDFALQPMTQQLIGAAFEVHNVLGFGFLEKVYQRAMQTELQLRGIKVEWSQKFKFNSKASLWVIMRLIWWWLKKSS